MNVRLCMGEYVIAKLHPRVLVSIDGRYDTVYPRDVIREHVDWILARPGGSAVLQKEEADFRWLAGPDRILVSDEILFAGIPRSSRRKAQARAFLLWLFQADPADFA